MTRPGSRPPDARPVDVDVVVIGAGQAGLSAAWALRARAGLEPGRGLVVLDADDGPGGAWRHRWPSLTMRRVHGLHALPGDASPRADPDAPAGAVVPAWFGAYEERFDLAVRRPIRVRAVRREDDDPAGRLLVESSAGVWRARAVVSATGTWGRPFWPRYPGAEVFRGRQLHAAQYRGAGELAGQHVVVVGGGTSAVQILADLADVATTTWVTRRPPVWRESFDAGHGRAVVAAVADAVREGGATGSVVGYTGLVVTDEVRRLRERGRLDRQPPFARLTEHGVAWADGRELPADTVLWATGFRPALDHLAPLRLREPGGGVRLDGTRAVREPRLHLVGYGPSASTVGANRAGQAAAREVRRLLSAPAAA